MRARAGALTAGAVVAALPPAPAAAAEGAASSGADLAALLIVEGPDWWPFLALILLARLLHRRPELLSRLPHPDGAARAGLEARVAALEAELARLREGAPGPAPASERDGGPDPGADPAPDLGPVDAVPAAPAPALPASADLYDRAVAVVAAERKATPKHLTRRLSIGWEEAASLLSRMEAEGIVSARDEAGARAILRAEGPAGDAA